MDVCTIVAKNYIAQARVLAQSLLEHNPEARLSVLVVDEYDDYIDPSAEPFRLISPSQINCSAFAEMVARYSVLELSTAVKPWLLRMLLDEGSPAVTYLDPDIRVYGSLSRLDELARNHGLVLTPHNTKPIRDDGELPTQHSILVSGAYNLGYLSIASTPATDALIAWWGEHLVEHCRVDTKAGYFVDQRWFDLAPSFVEGCAIVHEPEFNVAYWNLHDRPLRRMNSRYFADGRPLAFFHFSGFDPNEPHVLSRFQTRVRLSEHPEVVEICREYAQALFSSGFEEASGWSYTYGALPDGTRFSRPLRELYGLARDAGELRASPFTETGFGDFLRWLAQPPPGAPPGFNRLLAHAYAEHTELQTMFPEITWRDRDRFFAFAATSNDYDLSLIAAMADRGLVNAQIGSNNGVAQHDSSAIEKAPWGVNVVGFFHSDFSHGIAARGIVAALDGANVPVLPADARSMPVEHEDHAFWSAPLGDHPFAASVVVCDADTLAELAAGVGDRLLDNHYSIGLWFTEVCRFPERLQRAFELLDEVWVPSEHLVETLRDISPVPVSRVVIPLPLRQVPRIPHEALGLPEGFMFFSSFDYAAVFERKNPLGLVEAFKAAFEPGEGAVLVIKCLNERTDLNNHERLMLAAQAHPDIHVIADYWDRGQQDAAIAGCDCYVSLHRSEGFPMAIAEAMLQGKPAIATRYGGNLDFMTAQNSLLVDYELGPIGANAKPYPRDREWAKPDAKHAAALMRQVFDDQDGARELGRRAAADLRTACSVSAASDRIAELLAPVHDLWRARAADSRPTRRLPPLSVTLEAAPANVTTMKARSVRTLARNAALRALGPYAAQQQTFNAEVGEALTRVEPELMRLQRRLSSIEERLDSLAAGAEHPASLAAQRSESSE